ncbi:MAG: hypothetical protein RIQ82_704, partial [Bacteroidota bacterium]
LGPDWELKINADKLKALYAKM